ncbi:primosomal protein N' [Acuticoccus mangrovi]|uniref:Replication restart protein PriA n=1 Tax=Acuticoccus mangrovi TaxID=2796142 RepID=A0A934IPC8_9HYPH|nr:primosomal protein N' [Acuticoccus mangrovi]MBJ3776108.1 primosomal protein N' [Acuticoccus mangrovi]
MTPEPERLSVLLPHRLGLLTYRAAEGVRPGDVVAVPLGGRTVVGVVWDEPPDETIADARLRPVAGRVGDIAIGADLRRFVDFVAHYTMTPPGAILRMVLRAPDALVPPKPLKALALSGTAPERSTGPREKVLAALADGPLTRKALLEASGASTAVVTGLLKAGVLEETRLAEVPPPRPDPQHRPPHLSPAQEDAADALKAMVGAGFSTVLLEGVTGSGKTEVYLEAIAAALAAGRQALVLMPEIALTPMVTARLSERFGVVPGEWHSGRTPAARTALWRDVATGRADIVVGARSALFLPFDRLGLIVVDEEHDPSFKQEDGVIYHARDMAIVRAKEADVPVVLASATPSVETRLNAESGRYRHLMLGTRHGGLALPDIRAVDLRATPPPRGEWLSPPVRQAVADTLKAGEQALLFLNRRGYAPLTVCRRCGHRFHCPNCSASLVEHRLRGRLVCHHCGHEEPRPRVCPSCGGEDTLAPCGPGVERVEEEVRALWPEARATVLSSDLAGGPQALVDALGRVARGEVDIVIGTQLVAKGYTFPRLQLVAVVDADLGLENGDPRAAERTFQMLTQVTGRAGRVTAGGRALLQTHAPDHPVIRAMVRGDGEAFYAEETLMRRDGGLPPFHRLAAVIVSAAEKAEAHAHAAALARTAPTGEVEVLGPAEAPLAVLRGRYRYRLLVRAPRRIMLQPILADWLAAVPVEGTVRRAVDIDPQSFL